MAFRSLLTFIDLSKLDEEQLTRVLRDLRKLRDEAEERRDDAERDLNRVAESIRDVRDEIRRRDDKKNEKS